MLRRLILKGLLAMAFTGGDGGPTHSVNRPRASLPPQRLDQRYTPPDLPALAPTSAGIFRGRLVIVYGSGANTGVFVYNGAPAAGNPPIFWATSASSDPFGNALPSTVGVAGSGTFEAGNTIVNASGTFVYSTTPAADKLIASIAPAVGTDAFGNAYLAGEATYRKILPLSYVAAANTGGSVAFYTATSFGGPWNSTGAVQASGSMVLSTTAAGNHVLLEPNSVTVLDASTTEIDASVPVVIISSGGAGARALQIEISGDTNPRLNTDNTGRINWGPGNAGTDTFLSRNSTGILQHGNASGMIARLPFIQTDTSSNTNGNNATQPVTASWSIPANDAQVGTIYEVEVPFDGTFETTTLALEGYLDASVHASSTIGASFFTAGQTFNGTARIKLQVTATGAGGSCVMALDGGLGLAGNRSSGANSNSTYLSSNAVTVAFDTTVSHTLAVAASWGGVAAGQTITGHGSKFTRSGP